jgi:hypothetical protein
MNLQLQCLAESDIDSEVDTVLVLRKDGIDAQVYFLVLSCGISPAEVTLGSIIANFKSAQKVPSTNSLLCIYRCAYSRAGSRKVFLVHIKTEIKIDTQIIRYLHQRHHVWWAIAHYTNPHITGEPFVWHIRKEQVNMIF